jgi:hypothetical protein
MRFQGYNGGSRSKNLWNVGQFPRRNIPEDKSSIYRLISRFQNFFIFSRILDIQISAIFKPNSFQNNILERENDIIDWTISITHSNTFQY